MDILEEETRDNPLKKLKLLNRRRVQQLFNLAPIDIAKKEAPDFVLKLERFITPDIIPKKKKKKEPIINQ